MASTARRDWCAVVFALVLPTIVTLVYFVWAAESESSVQQMAFAVAKFVQFAFPVVWVLAVQRHWPKWHNGIRETNLQTIAFGLVIAITTLVLYLLVFRSMASFQGPLEAISEKILGLGIDQPLKFAAFGAFYVVFHSLLEEYYWRWFVFGQLDRLVSTPTAIAVSALGFMAHHVIVLATYFGWASPATWIFSLCVAVGGAVWAWAYHRGGSLLSPWVSHGFVDAAIFLIGYDLANGSFGA